MPLEKMPWHPGVNMSPQKWDRMETNYNHHFNSILPSHHPNLVSFAKAIQDEADQVIQMMENIVKHHEIPPNYNEPVFLRFLMNSGRKSLLKRRKKQRLGAGGKGLGSVVLQSLFCADICHCMVIK